MRDNPRCPKCGTEFDVNGTKPIGERHREARVRARLSLRDMARLTGIEIVRLGKIERGVEQETPEENEAIRREIERVAP